MGVLEDMKASYESRLTGDLESVVREINGTKHVIYWKPLTGEQQKAIQRASAKSVAEGICMHVKLRALDENGELIFKNEALAGMMTTMDYQRDIMPIFIAMTDDVFSPEDIEKNS